MPRAMHKVFMKDIEHSLTCMLYFDAKFSFILTEVNGKDRSDHNHLHATFAHISFSVDAI